jgi:hypothetical protein
MSPSFVCMFEFNGRSYKIEFIGISYRCAELKIYGEKTERSCKNSIKRKLKKGVSHET